MNRLVLIVCAAALLIAPWNSQAQNAQTQNEMTMPEFRQVLVDLGSYLDIRKGTDLRRQFESAPDDELRALLPSVSNPRGFQHAVAQLNASLKEPDAMSAPRGGSSPNDTASTSSLTASAEFPACLADTIIDDLAGSADGTRVTTCTPSYPTPTNFGWVSLVTALFPVKALTGGFASAASQRCDLDVESNPTITASVLQALVESVTPICSILPPVINIPCWAPVAAIAVAGSVAQGLLNDCTAQDGNINASQIEAAFHNTVTLYDSLQGVARNLTTTENTVSTINTNLTTVSNNLTTVGANLKTQITNVDTHLTNVDNHVAAELVTLVNQLSNQISQGTALLDAELRQVMKLELTPDGQKQINPAILTCTGTSCPNVLAACPTAGCSWNNAGPLP